MGWVVTALMVSAYVVLIVAGYLVYKRQYRRWADPVAPVENPAGIDAKRGSDALD